MFGLDSIPAAMSSWLWRNRERELPPYLLVSYMAMSWHQDIKMWTVWYFHRKLINHDIQMIKGGLEIPYVVKNGDLSLFGMKRNIFLTEATKL